MKLDDLKTLRTAVPAELPAAGFVDIEVSRHHASHRDVVAVLARTDAGPGA